jgi:quinolinate synthase
MTAQTDLPTGEDLLAAIDRLRKEKNAIILAHYYQTADLQDIADFVGDSLELSRKAAETDADVIVFCPRTLQRISVFSELSRVPGSVTVTSRSPNTTR